MPEKPEKHIVSESAMLSSNTISLKLKCMTANGVN